MVAPFLSRQIKHAIVVAGEKWQRRIASDLNDYFESILWFDNCFEALAAILEKKDDQTTIMMLIMVDHLCPHEMQVFNNATQLQYVQTIALSNLDDPGQKKFMQAKQSGADVMSHLDKLKDCLMEYIQTASPQTKKVTEKVDKAPLETTELKTETIQNDHSPTITDQELEALLGFNEPTDER